MATAMFRGRSLKTRKIRDRRQDGDETVVLDYSRAPSDNLQEVLTNLVKREGTSKAKKLGYYNAFVRFCYRHAAKVDTDLSKEEILCCLRLGLLHEAKEMRAACLRALRYFCQDEDTVKALLRLHVDYLIARSLDICLDNEIERIHALRLIRKIMAVCPQLFPQSLLSVMIAIASDGVQERDRMVRTCLATICELTFHNSSAVAQPRTVSCILKNVLECHQLQRINESLLATVLYLLNHPRTRQYIKINVDLEQLLAPFTDSHYKNPVQTPEHAASGDKENRFSASKMAIATAMKSWPGIIRLCRPDSSGLQSLIGVLYLPNMETRKEIMDILYDVFRLAIPVWTEDFSKALLSVDPSEMRDCWKLSEGFVAEEGKTLLPHLAKTRQNLVDNHMAVILSALICAGLFEALIEVVVTSDEHVSVRGTVLLGELLHLASTILPHECGHHSHCLPSLMCMATACEVGAKERNRANKAVNCLGRLHAMKKRGTVPCSLYLDQIVQNATRSSRSDASHPLKLSREKLIQSLEGKRCIPLQTKKTKAPLAWMKRQCIPLSVSSSVYDFEHDALSQAIKDSQVLNTKSNFDWDWDLIAAVLKWPDQYLMKLEDQSSQRFVRRLLYFFKPSNKLFSAIKLSQEDHQKFAIVGLCFTEFLLECEDDETRKFREEWLTDIALNLKDIRVPHGADESLFATSSLMTTCCQYYFLFIGCFSATQNGDKLLESLGLYQYLLDLMTLTSQDTYIKLIVSCLDYSRDGLSRIILSKGLTATSESARLYTASFMRILLRARVPLLSSWGMEMLVLQLYDQSKAVAMEALSVISEACEDEVNLHALVNMRPSVLHLGYKGAMLLARFLAIPSGYKYLMDANYVHNELEKWHKSFNIKYAQIVEERLDEALTTYEKTYDGSYVRRSHRRQPRKDVYIPVHLYGQLVQHKRGFQLLESQEYLIEYFNIIKYQELKTDEQVLRLKAALWAVGHIGTSQWGVGLLDDQGIIPEMIKLAEECGVFSVRGTAYYVLGLVSSTTKGASILHNFGWETVRHKHSETWAVVDPGDSEDDGDASNSSVSSLSLSNSGRSEGARGSSVILPTVTVEDPGRYSPHSYGSSPKPCFYIDSGEFSNKSRSNTGSTPLVYGSSHEESPRNSLDQIHEDRISETRRVTAEVTRSAEGSVETKERSGSMPAVSRKVDLIHPRSQSDPPRGLLEKEGQSTVTFKDEVSDMEEERKSSASSDSVPKKTPREQILRKRTPSNTETPAGKSEATIKGRGGSFRDERSGSDPATKSRSDSINTDTTTSGVGSYDSSPHGVLEHAPLTPIPSASSVGTDSGSHVYSPQDSDSRSSSVHPSDVFRKLANLKRVPSNKRRYSNPVLGHISPLGSVRDRKRVNSETSPPYTSNKDVQGYAALRELQRKRTLSAAEMENEGKLGGVFEDTRVPKTRSLDFRLGRPSSARNLSVVSLQDYDGSSPFSPYPNPTTSACDTVTRCSSASNLRKLKTPPGRTEFLGLCLPVDINMLFQISEGEDRRSLVNLPESETEEGQPEYKARLATKLRSISQTEEDNSGLEYHTTQNCLACYKMKDQEENKLVFVDAKEDPDDDEAFVFTSKPGSQPASGAPTPLPSQVPSPVTTAAVAGRGIKSRNSSFSDMLVNIPGSITSTTSIESSAKPQITEDTEAGRALIRKEVLRFITNLSSSVGVKSAEQGLLMLKQKFSRVFQDLCVYSEICHLLASYNFRLTSRRFIQELFQEVNFDELYEEPKALLGITEEPDAGNDVNDADRRLERVLESIA